VNCIHDDGSSVVCAFVCDDAHGFGAINSKQEDFPNGGGFFFG
jgi:hypothetical protein